MRTGRDWVRAFSMAAQRVESAVFGCAIESKAFDAVAGGALPELDVAGKLLGDGRRVGVAIVFDNEDDGQGEHRGEIERLVDVAGAGGAVAEEGEADGGAALAAL